MKAKKVNENLNDVPIPGGNRDPKARDLESTFNAAAAAMNELNEIVPSELDEELYQLLMTAEGAVEELMDAIDAKLQR